MSDPRLILMPRDGTWRVAIIGDLLTEVPFADAADAREIASLAAARQADTRAWIALPSRACLCVPLAADAVRRTRSTEAIKFALEEQLPWSAEEFSVAVIGSSESAALAIATRTAELDAYVDDLKSAGIAVAGASPLALLAAAGVEGRDHDAVIIGDGEWVDCVDLDRGRVVQWRWLPMSDLPAQLEQRKPSNLAAIGLPGESFPDSLLPADVRIANRHPESAEAIAARQAAAILYRQAAAVANFRGASGHRPTRSLIAVAIAAILLGLSAGMIARTFQYQHAAERAAAAERAQFVRAFPHSPVPAGIVSRLIGEARSMRASAGMTGESSRQSPSISPSLARILAAVGSLPASVRFTIDDFSLDADRLSLTGRAATLNDAKMLSDAVKSVPGWTVAPLHSEQRLAAVSFTVQASGASGGGVARSDGEALP